MLRSFLVGVCSLLLRTFFRRIEVVGRHHLPEDGALLFTLNHPSGLIDPLFILCLSGRRVSFLAKEPLFRMPVVGIFVKAFECLPVYRSQDGADPAKNRAMMRAAADLLARGNALALFPEGTSHDDSDLKRFRSGAARIALSARALGDQPVRVVPAALYYETKQTFRSRAVLAFGAPLDVPQVALDEAGSPPIEIGQELTQELAQAIRRIMPTADSAEGLVLAEQAERVFNAAVRDTPQECPTAVTLIAESHDGFESAPGRPGKLSLGQRMKTRRRLIDAFLQLSSQVPEQVQALVKRVSTLRDQMELHSLPIDARPHAAPDWWTQRLPRILALTFLGPIALAGIVTHYPSYFLVRWIAFRYAGNQLDVTATTKLLAGLLLFPVTWLVWAGVLAYALGEPLWLLASLTGPLVAGATVMAGDIAGELSHSFSVGRRAKKAPLKWPEVVAARAQLAEDIARLMRE